jgi:hypothetical protein
MARTAATPRASYTGVHPFWDVYADCMISKGYEPG